MAINDTGGHAAGDELLKSLARAIETTCRHADLPARLGGDEFAVLLPETVAGDAGTTADRIREAFAATSATGMGIESRATLSIGVADLNSGELDSPGAMISLADKALYAAKELGRNRVVQAHDLNGLSLSNADGKASADTLCKKLAGLDTQFKDLFVRAIEEVISVLEERDPHMGDHARKVQHYAVLIAQQMGLPERLVKRIQIAAMLHDIGMVAMPDAVLLSPTQLDETQLAVMRKHPLLSVRIMEGMEFLEQEIPAVRYHHERFDGKGYPEGIAGPAIPLTARILAVADCFDAMVSPRAFRSAKPAGEALRELKAASGSQFDPVVVDAFAAVAERLRDSLTKVEVRRGGATLGSLLGECDSLPSPAPTVPAAGKWRQTPQNAPV